MPQPTPLVRSRPDTASRRHELALRLADLAEAQIAAAGLSSLRARPLAEAAGCAVGAIYGVFPDLDELVLTVNARTLDAIGAALNQATLDGAAADAPGDRLVRLADSYLEYAAGHRHRWDALFLHRMAAVRPLPDWYVARRHAAFQPLAAPLAALDEGRPEAEQAALARALFAAVHGVVALGLDEMLGSTTPAALRRQLRLVVQAMATGLAREQAAEPGGPRVADQPPG